MTTPLADVGIIGLGAMGSAAAYHLAKRGKTVIGFDRFKPPHSLGSTHGESRIIREAYFEDPLYVPLVQRSYECWNELEKTSGEKLLLNTGGVLLGPPDGMLVGGARLSADRYGLDYELLTAAQVRQKYPALRPNDKMVGLFEPRAGILLPEKCVEVHLEQAAEMGSALHFNEPVDGWIADANNVTIRTGNGTYQCGQLLLSPGPWMSQMISDVSLPLTIERQLLYWFEPVDKPDSYSLGQLPIYAWEYAEREMFYGFPNLGSGVKIALHHQGEMTDVDAIERDARPEEIEGMEQFVEIFFPELNGPVMRTEVCMYTNTPDENFLIDFHPQHSNVLIASPCSGHGFKFAAVIGEVLADLLSEGKSQFDLTSFALKRLTKDQE